MDNKAWLKEAQFGMMIHFGLYSILGGEWKGKCMNLIGEWAQSYFKIPNKEYHQLARVFNPIYFDADEWVSTAKAAGMKYIVVTSKHHEGFALFQSDACKFNAVDGSPFGRDIIGELAAACKKHGIRLGIYYSQAIDWAHPDGFCARKTLNAGMTWGNEWDYPDFTKKDYRRCFEEKIKPQIKELLTKYGDLCLMWFDTPFEYPEEYSKEIYALVKSIQPDCMINSRLGNGYCDYISAGDNQIPSENTDGGLYEAPGTLNRTWGFKATDQDWKSAEEILRRRNQLRDRGINYLLNIGPDALGRFPAKATEILLEVGKLI